MTSDEKTVFENAAPGFLQEGLPWMARRARAWRVAVASVIVAVYAAGISPYWSVGGDSGLYLNLARNLARGEGYTLAGIPHVHVPPAFPWMVALLMRVGAGSFLALNTVMCVLGLVTALFIYLLLSRLVHRDWALLLAAACALSIEMVRRSGEIMTDMPFMLLVIAGLWLYARGVREDARGRWWEAGSILLVASAWVRVVGFPVALGAAAGLALSAGGGARRRAIVNAAIVAGGLAGSLAFFGYYYATHADPTASSYISTVGEFKGGGSILRFAYEPFVTLFVAGTDLSRLYTGQGMPPWTALVVFVVPVLVAMARRIVRGERLTVLTVVLFIGATVASFPVVRTRYLLPVMPLLVLYVLEGYGLIASLVKSLRPKAGRLAFGLVAIFVLANMPLVVRSIVEKHRSDYFASQRHGEWRDEFAVADFLKSVKAPGDKALATQDVSFLADVPAPGIAASIAKRPADDERLRELLAHWNVRYVVVKRHEDADKPFLIALRRYLASAQAPVFVYEDTEVYKLR